MPDRFPGVYVEDGDLGDKPIEGVSTNTAAFVGPTRCGPTQGRPDLLTSFADFERVYGGLEHLDFDDVAAPVPNDTAHAVRAFFAEGGEWAYVARIFRPGAEEGERPTGPGDGRRPTAADYEGSDGPSGLRALEDLEDISIVAAPGSTRDTGCGEDRHNAEAVMQLLIAHCERVRYRVAVLDSINGQSPDDIRGLRGALDSSHAALYYPWVSIDDPLAGGEILLPPSGFVAGIYARTDAERGVHEAPANQVIRSARGLEVTLDKAQQEVLNPLGINCLRHLEGLGFRVWGARTVSSDPEWKYVNVRRYFLYLERSIDKGTEWAVFEPNGESLWDRVRHSIERFLHGELTAGRLQGAKPEDAFFVRCDRTAMTQADIDAGRLVCLIGVAPVRPAEFVIFRIGQKTADSVA